MMKNLRRFLSIFCMFALSITLISCGNRERKSLSERANELNAQNQESLNSVTEASIVEPATEPAIASGSSLDIAKEDTHEGETRSLLTGEWIDDKYEGKRPYAFMFNNIQYAYPQCGTGRAGIMYEILAEGGITRLMGVFDYMKGDRIGSARSARHYYVDFANEFNAIYIHYGQTKYATAEIQKLGVDEISGLAAEGNYVFYRDNNIPAPHNAFATAAGIKKAVKNKKISTKLKDGVGAHFNFAYDEEVDNKMEGSKRATDIKLPFSAYMTPEFTYSKKSGRYTRHAFGTIHKDLSTGKALTFTNLFVQFVNEYNIDKKGYQTMDLMNNTGSGYYITKGRAVKVYWKKGNAESRTIFYYDKAFTDEVKVNTGKTYYAVFPDNRADMITFTSKS
ncbi:MAG: DUF3048 domain-containing protein [Catonella sp.]|nr:DUF3048 domain-containing protein [Catonella sp.]MDY6357534.1 DUF3048 domain-containing protein [Catonella sp.]